MSTFTHLTLTDLLTGTLEPLMLMGERLKTQLRVLNLTDNQVSLALALTLTLTLIQTLTLSLNSDPNPNQLTGGLEALAGFTALQGLDLAGNMFTGAPTSLERLQPSP